MNTMELGPPVIRCSKCKSDRPIGKSTNVGDMMKLSGYQPIMRTDSGSYGFRHLLV